MGNSKGQKKKKNQTKKKKGANKPVATLEPALIHDDVECAEVAEESHVETVDDILMEKECDSGDLVHPEEPMCPDTITSLQPEVSIDISDDNAISVVEQLNSIEPLPAQPNEMAEKDDEQLHILTDSNSNEGIKESNEFQNDEDLQDVVNSDVEMELSGNKELQEQEQENFHKLQEINFAADESEDEEAIPTEQPPYDDVQNPEVNDPFTPKPMDDLQSTSTSQQIINNEVEEAVFWDNQKKDDIMPWENNSKEEIMPWDNTATEDVRPFHDNFIDNQCTEATSTFNFKNEETQQSENFELPSPATEAPISSQDLQLDFHTTEVMPWDNTATNDILPVKKVENDAQNLYAAEEIAESRSEIFPESTTAESDVIHGQMQVTSEQNGSLPEKNSNSEEDLPWNNSADEDMPWDNKPNDGDELEFVPEDLAEKARSTSAPETLVDTKPSGLQEDELKEVFSDESVSQEWKSNVSNDEPKIPSEPGASLEHIPTNTSVVYSPDVIDEKNSMEWISNDKDEFEWLQQDTVADPSTNLIIEEDNSEIVKSDHQFLDSLKNEESPFTEEKFDFLEGDNDEAVDPKTASVSQEKEDKFDFLEDDDEIMLDDILDDDDFLDDDLEVESDSAQQNPQQTLSEKPSEPKTSRYQSKYQPQGTPEVNSSSEKRRMSQFTTNDSFTSVAPRNNNLPFKVLEQPKMSFLEQNSKVSELQKQKKKTDAYDFPQDILPKNVRKSSKVKENIYTRIESLTDHTRTEAISLNNQLTMNNVANIGPPPVIGASAVSKVSRSNSVTSSGISNSSFFAELPVPKLNHKKSILPKNPYEQPGMNKTLENMSTAKSQSPLPHTVRNPYAPVPAPPSGAILEQHSHIQTPKNANHYAPFETLRPENTKSTTTPESSQLSIPPSSTFLKSAKIPSIKKASNPYAPAAAGGHIRQLSAVVPDPNQSMPNIVPVPMKSPSGIHHPTSSISSMNMQMPQNQALFLSQSNGQSGFNNNHLSASEAEPFPHHSATNTGGKYAPPAMQSDPQPPNSSFNVSGLIPDHRPANVAAKHKASTKSRHSTSITEVYGANIVTSNATSTHTRKMSALPPSLKAGKMTVPSVASLAPAPVVINPENLVMRQWPLFSFSSEDKIASAIPSYDAYGSTSCNINIGELSAILLEDKDIVTFPGPLMKSKTKRKDLIKWLDDKICFFDTETKSDSYCEELIWKCLKLMMEKIEKKDDFVDSEYVKGIANIINPTLDISADSNNSFDIINLTRIAQNFAPTIPYNSFALTADGLACVHKLLESGNKKGALEFAVSHGDWTMSLLIANLMGPIAFDQIIKLYSASHLSADATGQNLSFFIQSSFEAGITADQLHGKESWIVENFKVVIPFIMVDNPNYGKTFMQIGDSLSKAGYKLYAKLLYLLSGLPLVPQYLSELPTSIYGMITDEIYSFILVSSGNTPPNFSNGFPHMIPLMISHAGYLADCGHFVESKKYCEATQSLINSKQFFCENITIHAQNELSERLSKVGSSWLTSKLSRPQFERVWTSLDKSFNKFVAGEDIPAETEKPKETVFSKYTSPAPISREQSSLDLFDLKNQMTTTSNAASPNRASYSHGSRIDNLLPVRNNASGISNLQSAYQPPQVNPECRQRENSMDSVGSSLHGFAPSKYAPPPVNISSESLHQMNTGTAPPSQQSALSVNLANLPKPPPISLHSAASPASTPPMANIAMYKSPKSKSAHQRLTKPKNNPYALAEASTVNSATSAQIQSMDGMHGSPEPNSLSSMTDSGKSVNTLTADFDSPVITQKELAAASDVSGSGPGHELSIPADVNASTVFSTQLHSAVEYDVALHEQAETIAKKQQPMEDIIDETLDDGSANTALDTNVADEHVDSNSADYYPTNTYATEEIKDAENDRKTITATGNADNERANDYFGYEAASSEKTIHNTSTEPKEIHIDHESIANDQPILDQHAPTFSEQNSTALKPEIENDGVNQNILQETDSPSLAPIPRAVPRKVNRYGPPGAVTIAKKKPKNPYASAYAPKKTESAVNVVYAPEAESQSNFELSNTSTDLSGEPVDMFSFGGYSVPPPTAPIKDEPTGTHNEGQGPGLDNGHLHTVIPNTKDDTSTESCKNDSYKANISITESQISIPTFKPPTQRDTNGKHSAHELTDIFAPPPPQFTESTRLSSISSPIHQFTEEKKFHAEDTGEYYDDVVDDSDDEEESEILRKQRESEAKEKERKRMEEEKKRKQEEELAEKNKKEEELKKAKSEGGSTWFGWLSKGKDDKPKPIKAKLGEENSFYFDEKLNRWINSKVSLEEQLESSKPPPPPSMKKKSDSVAPATESNKISGSGSPPPSSQLPVQSSATSLSSPSLPPTPMNMGSKSVPAKKDSIDDLLNMKVATNTANKKGVRRGPRRGYVDVMGQQ